MGSGGGESLGRVGMDIGDLGLLSQSLGLAAELLLAHGLTDFGHGGGSGVGDE